MPTTHTVTLMAGDGIGREVTNAACRVVEASGVKVNWEPAEAGAEVFKKGVASGVPQDTIDSIARNKVALKGPLETPVGYGEKSANVTLRKLFELYANTRPTRDIPGVKTAFSGRAIDLVVVRENVEDLYAGIEHMQTPSVAQCLKLISRKGCEKIIRFAFELARAEGRKTIHCATKANIMKMTEGLMKRTFEGIAPEYPEIKPSHIIIDNCAHQLVRYPEQFEVIVTTNMNGDIISDLTSGLTGGLGLAPSANIGDEISMFEAVHGSAPDIAGQGKANPTALILSAVLMLRHLGEFDAAAKIENAIYVTLEEAKKVPADLAGKGAFATTDQFTDEVIANLGRTSDRIKSRDYKKMTMPVINEEAVLVKPKSRRVVGADLFIEFVGSVKELGEKLDAMAEGSPLKLKMISNRGTRAYPLTGTDMDSVDHWRCRFVMRDAKAEMTDADLMALVQKVAGVYTWNHIEKLMEFDGAASYTKAQGED
ncbi:MAG: NADP-dependent isocitrate dehydrogenase [Phycisphaerales bacterium]